MTCPYLFKLHLILLRCFKIYTSKFDVAVVVHVELISVDMIDEYVDLGCICWNPVNDCPWVHPAHRFTMEKWKAKCWIFSFDFREIPLIVRPHWSILTSISKIFNLFALTIVPVIIVAVYLFVPKSQFWISCLYHNFNNLEKALTLLDSLISIFHEITTLHCKEHFKIDALSCICWIQYTFTKLVQLIEVHDVFEVQQRH